MIVLLDAGPLGQIINPMASPAAQAANLWLESLLISGIRVAIPEISDYEVRRELVRRDNRLAVAQLDGLKGVLEYLPITTEAMLKAAEYWGVARQRGKAMAPDPALDGDVILAAQASSVSTEDDPAVIATTNVKHLALFADARPWREISAY